MGTLRFSPSWICSGHQTRPWRRQRREPPDTQWFSPSTLSVWAFKAEVPSSDNVTRRLSFKLFQLWASGFLTPVLLLVLVMSAWNAHLPFPSSVFPKCPPLSRLNSSTNSSTQVLSRPQKKTTPPLSSCCTCLSQLSLLGLHSVVSVHHLTFSTISLWQLSEQRQVWRLRPYGYTLFVKEMRTAMITFLIQSLF